MEIFIAWIIFSIIVGVIGNGRKIGFPLAFFLSILLSPAIGLIIALASKSESQDQFEKKTIELQKKQIEVAETTKQDSTADEMRKLKELLDEGILSWEEFNTLKDKLLNR